MRPAGLHTHGTDLTEVIGALAVIAGVAVAVEFILSIIWIIAVAVGLAVAAAIVLLVWMARRGSAVAAVSWQPRAAIPAPQAQPITARQAKELPAPQHVHYHLHVDQAAISEWSATAPDPVSDGAPRHRP